MNAPNSYHIMFPIGMGIPGQIPEGKLTYRFYCANRKIQGVCPGLFLMAYSVTLANYLSSKTSISCGMLYLGKKIPPQKSTAEIVKPWLQTCMQHFHPSAMALWLEEGEVSFEKQIYLKCMHNQKQIAHI